MKIDELKNKIKKDSVFSKQAKESLFLVFDMIAEVKKDSCYSKNVLELLQQVNDLFKFYKVDDKNLLKLLAEAKKETKHIKIHKQPTKQGFSKKDVLKIMMSFLSNNFCFQSSLGFDNDMKKNVKKRLQIELEKYLHEKV